MLAAARAVFDAADSPEGVTMDAVAAAAGVGKGTVFRAFGDRNGLLDALVDAEFAGLRSAVDDCRAPYFYDDAPLDKVGAFLDAMLDFKLANGNLMRARENTPTVNNLTSERYGWMHRVLHDWIEQAVVDTSLSPSFVAHVLLLPLQIDVVDQLVGEGMSIDVLRLQLAHHRDALLSGDAQRTT